MHVLVVDDDREIVESISIFLSGEGYKAPKARDSIPAQSPQDSCLRALCRERPAQVSARALRSGGANGFPPMFSMFCRAGFNTPATVGACRPQTTPHRP